MTPHNIDGVAAHSVREIQRILAERSHTGHELALTDEHWYADDLRRNVMVKHGEPRAGTVTLTLIQPSRGGPDGSLSLSLRSGGRWGLVRLDGTPKLRHTSSPSPGL